MKQSLLVHIAERLYTKRYPYALYAFANAQDGVKDDFLEQAQIAIDEINKDARFELRPEAESTPEFDELITSGFDTHFEMMNDSLLFIGLTKDYDTKAIFISTKEKNDPLVIRVYKEY